MVLLNRERMARHYTRAKGIASRAWQGSMKIMSATDKAAMLAARGLLVLGDRLDPEVRQQATRALQTYGNGRQTVQNVTDNVQRVGRAVREAGFDL